MIGSQKLRPYLASSGGTPAGLYDSPLSPGHRLVHPLTDSLTIYPNRFMHVAAGRDATVLFAHIHEHYCAGLKNFVDGSRIDTQDAESSADLSGSRVSRHTLETIADIACGRIRTEPDAYVALAADAVGEICITNSITGYHVREADHASCTKSARLDGRIPLPIWCSYLPNRISGRDPGSMRSKRSTSFGLAHTAMPLCRVNAGDPLRVSPTPIPSDCRSQIRASVCLSFI